MDLISRDEFEKRLHVIFDSVYHPVQDDIMLCILEDAPALARVRDLRTNRDTKINGYLSQYDAASTDEDKMAIVTSVQRDS